MKKILIVVFSMITVCAIAQKPIKNGTIYKEHPYITVVNRSIEFFLSQNFKEFAKLYADSAKFYEPLSTKPENLANRIKSYMGFLKNWENVEMPKQKGSYPDGLEYDDGSFIVQSWWAEKAVNKKTGKTENTPFVVFDEFNKDGKIITETFYYDRSSIKAASK